MVGKRVKRIIIECVTSENITRELTHADVRNGRAVGIEYTSDAISCPGSSGELITARAAKLVVVSGGAFGSPSILERSGIGAPSVLEKNNIRVLVDLPGVGENYQGMSYQRTVVSGSHKFFHRPLRFVYGVLRIR